MQADKRNMERMVDAVPDSDYQEGPTALASLTRDCTCRRVGRRIHDVAIALTVPEPSRSIESVTDE
jgi:hypothetical protein